MSRIVLTTIGSLGDLHPFIAIGLALRERGHTVVCATTEFYRAKIESLGFAFHAIRPEFSPEDKELIRYLLDIRKGPERLLREYVLPDVKDTCFDLIAAIEQDGGADLLLSSELVYAAPLVAEKTGIRWASSITAPLSFFSAYDLPVMPMLQLPDRVRSFSVTLNRGFVALGKFVTRSWCEPVRQLRAELGLAGGRHPMFEGKHSPQLVLALFSPVLATPKPDWPPQTVVTGHTFYDGKEEGMQLCPELERFLDEGDPPLVFTLGSAAVCDPGTFFRESAAAALALHRRAVLLVGADPPALSLPAGVVAYDYAPFSDIFPRAAAIVHQGGIGTTGQALRAGRPMLVIPYGFDQPDNAARLVMLGVGRSISRKKYTADSAVKALKELLGNPRPRERAEELGRIVRAENGAQLAADALEHLLRGETR